jgi:hypothetical protein
MEREYTALADDAAGNVNGMRLLFDGQGDTFTLPRLIQNTLNVPAGEAEALAPLLGGPLGDTLSALYRENEAKRLRRRRILLKKAEEAVLALGRSFADEPDHAQREELTARFHALTTGFLATCQTQAIADGRALDALDAYPKGGVNDDKDTL